MGPWLAFTGGIGGIEGSGNVVCAPNEEGECAFADNRDMVPVLDIAMRERMALTIFMIPSIPSTSISVSIAFDCSSGSLLGGP